MNEQRRNASRWLTGAAMVLAVAACSDTTGIDNLDDDLLMEAALVAADATLEDVQIWMGPFDFGIGLGGAPPGATHGDHPTARPGGNHGIGSVLSGTREVTFFDADGNEQDRYDSETTDVIHFVIEIAGEVSRDTWSASVSRARDKTVSGLAGAETHRTFNGTGTESVSRARHSDDVNRSYDLSGSVAYSDVVVPVPGSDPRYPVSGTISRSMTVTRTNGDETRTRSVEVTITFDGDETATIVVNGEEMEIDLSTREGRNPIRGRRGGTGG